MATRLDTRCDVCSAVASRVMILDAGEAPPDFDSWAENHRRIWRENYADSRSPRLIYAGIEAGSGAMGTEISARKARRFVEILTPPISYRRVRSLGMHDDVSVCLECRKVYCATHWSVGGGSSLGVCPQGHPKSLDPF